jgi:hypothetical protein
LSLASLQGEIYYQITTPSPLPTGIVGQTYNGANGLQLMASGGSPSLNGTYTWQPNPGGLPAGLSLSSAGLISGTPTQVGTNQFTVQVMDAGQRTTSKVFLIGITK